MPGPLPVCPGIEAAGIITAVGKGVEGLEVGDRVCYASPPLGAYCEERDFPDNKIVKTPDSISCLLYTSPSPRDRG